MLRMQETWLRSMIKELDPTRLKKKIPHATTKTQHNQINIFLKKSVSFHSYIPFSHRPASVLLKFLPPPQVGEFPTPGPICFLSSLFFILHKYEQNLTTQPSSHSPLLVSKALCFLDSASSRVFSQPLLSPLCPVLD